MTDLPSSLGIEAVELLGEAGRSVTVRVSGRWRRRRPEARGQATLVVDVESGRQRFPAMPEPPSLSGAAPGTWRMSFSVPAALAQALPGRTFLQLGGVMVRLPVGEVPTGGSDVLEERRARGSELAAESARRRAVALAEEVMRLEHELDGARMRSERLWAQIAERERRLRVAEQHLHAERSRRAEVEEELSRVSRAAQHDLEALRGRVAKLERELRRMRRAVDEAEHLAAAAEAACRDAERRLAERARPPHAETNSIEFKLLRATPSASPARDALPFGATSAADRTALALEMAMTRARDALPNARAAALEAELAAAREEIEAQRRRSDRAYAAIEVVRVELGQLSAGPPARASPHAAPLRGSFSSTASAASQDEPVQAERLSAALARLRDQAGPIADAAPIRPVESTPRAAATTPWLATAFRELVAQDAAAAGRLLLALLPAQRAADPRPVAYDLVLGDLACVQVTVGSSGVRVEIDAMPRVPAEVDFQLEGDLASIARLLAARGVRRRLHLLAARGMRRRPHLATARGVRRRLHPLTTLRSRGRRRLGPWPRVPRLRGDARPLASLDRLIAARLTLGELDAAGVRLDPVLAMTLSGLMIEPAWTTGERFVIAHREPGAASADAYLHVRDGAPPRASGEAPQRSVEAVVVCPSSELIGGLAGVGAPAELLGEQRPLMLLRRWLDRAQCG